MKVERKRIFISDLPETIAEDDIKSAFQNYGTVLSAEIKTRREIGPKNNSLHFAYVSIEIDDKTLQQF
ncbi:hypothetical protein NQ317_012033 [Molorchus minor]|uniref:RRM domain-containing protein n=1 Tax=Molorchus minor TaxID=1323400 RepID=A0ABQ9J090_9CUCU|nr:hypothetical protein NQ317_012033 [Molorchus minor]